MKKRGLQFTKVLVGLFLLVSVIFPLIKVFLCISPKDISKLIHAPQFAQMIVHSIAATSISTIISVGIAWCLAWCINRSNIRYKGVFSVLFTLPMLIPSISHGMGLVLLFGDNGIFSNIFGINIGLYGYKGIIIGSVLYSFPVAFLMLTDVFKYEDYTVYEAAKVLGLNKRQQFFTITIPNFRKALISVVFATFTLIFTDYGVPLVVGGKIMTIPVYMYREVIGLLDFSKGAIIGVILLIPAVLAFIIDLKCKDAGNISTVTKVFEIENNKKRDNIAKFFCAFVILIISMPLITFMFLSIVNQYPIDMSFSLANITEAFQIGVGMDLMNSLLIALLTSFIGMTVIYLTAYLTARSQKNFSTMTLHLISMISLAIPGVVLGLSYVLFFGGTLIYGSIIILVLVNMVHFFASPYLVAYNSLNKFNSNLEDVAEVIGVSRVRMIVDVYIPSTKESILEIFSYIFVNCMVTISAVSFLANFKNMPLALLIPQFDSQSLIEATAFISILILSVNGLMKLAIYLLKRKMAKEAAC